MKDTPTGLFLPALILCATLEGQGVAGYLNFESPQCKPVAVATVLGQDYVLLCNTPDNTVEILDTVGHGLVATVRVGLEPVSVVFNAPNSCFYTTNFLGDSVTRVLLTRAHATAPLVATVEGTEQVGDEPMHVSFSPDGSTGFVTLSSEARLAAIDATTLQVLGRYFLGDVFPVPTSNTSVVREPRTTLIRGGDVYVLNGRGGKVPSFSLPVTGTGLVPYDLDLWVFAGGTPRLIPSQPLAPSPIGLATHNFNMALANNDDLFVVGTESLFEVVSEANVRALAVQNPASSNTGFVRTMIYKVTGANSATPTIDRRDLNLTGGVQVPYNDSLAHAMDVVVYEPAGGPRRLYLAAFNSDRVGVVDPTGAAVGWPIVARIPVVPQRPSGNPQLNTRMAGPRGLAVKYAKPGVVNDPGDRIYVLNRIDNSLAIIDPGNNTITGYYLLRDPRPAYIRDGAQFLYSAKLSGNGTVSCASCHIDARTDNFIWNLSDHVAVSIPGTLLDGYVNQPVPNTWAGEKGFLVTQTLQGLVNFEVDSRTQDLFSNAPYHWRGDRANFQAFNPAFQNLMARATQLTAAEMDAYTTFINSVAYPPNPAQPKDRVHSGSLGVANDELTGTGAQRGMKLFHTRAIMNGAGTNCGGRSCVQCHALREGGNNRLTVTTQNLLPPIPPGFGPHLETAPIRLLRQKDMMLRDGPTRQYVGGTFGSAHEGQFFRFEEFLSVFFGPLSGTEFANQTDFAHLTAFVREFDTGVAPIVGFSTTLRVGYSSTTDLAAIEAQVLSANSGLAVTGRIAGANRGFFFDLAGSNPTNQDYYREEPSGTRFTRAALLALLQPRTGMPQDLLTFEATPLGSDRRICWPHAVLPPIAGAAPSRVQIEPFVPIVAFASVPLFTNNWRVQSFFPPPREDFFWTKAPAIATPPSLQTLRLLQHAIMAGGVVPPTVDMRRHEAPRRFQVAGQDIRDGAQLRVWLNTSSVPPQQSTQFLEFVLPIHPTDQFVTDAQGPKRVWQTAAELEPLFVYMMLLGGPGVTNMAGVINNPAQYGETPPAFTPATHNFCFIGVFNADSTVGFGGFQPLRIQ